MKQPHHAILHCLTLPVHLRLLLGPLTLRLCKCLVAQRFLLLGLCHREGALLLCLHPLNLGELLPSLVIELRSLGLKQRVLDAQLVALLLHHKLPDVREVGAPEGLE